MARLAAPDATSTSELRPERPGIHPERISVVIPAFNEADRLYANLRTVCAVLDGSEFEVVVVDDGSQDATFEESLRAAADGLPIRAFRLENNRGKGAALFHGFKQASGDIIAFLDADLEISPEEIPTLLAAMRSSEAEVAVGVKRWRSTSFPLARRALSLLYRWLVALLFGLSLSDTQTGLKLFRREVLEDAVPRLRVSRFAFDIELLVAASRFGYRIVEGQVAAGYARDGQVGRIRGGHMVGMLLDTIGVYFRGSFWYWLQPALTTRAWMIAFVVGVLFFGIGVGKILTPVVLAPPISKFFYVFALQFLPRGLRDWLLVVAGLGLLLISLIQLNKSLLNAFARRDHGDLAGILRRK